MKKISFLFLSAIIAFILPSCNDEDWNGDELLKTEGTLSLSSLNIEFSEVDTNGSTNTESIDVSNFIINIINQQSQIINTWNYKNIPDEIILKTGEYTIEVKSHDTETALWETPYYYGSHKIRVTENETHAIDNITCSLSNVIISINYSDDLFQLLNENSNVKISLGNATLEYSRDEVRAGHFILPSASSVVIAEMSAIIDNETFTVIKNIPNIEIGKHYVISFSTEDLTNFVNPYAPSITSETLNLDSINVITSDIIAKVDINAPFGINNFIVDIISEQLTKEMLQDVGLDSTFDLAYPGELQEPLTELGFPTGDAVIGKTQLAFDITDFMQLLVLFPGQHQFKLTITDSNGYTTTKTLSFLAPQVDNSIPTITSETLDLNSTNIITEDIIAKVDINAPNGIKNFIVDIISEQLTKELLQEVGLDSTFDLAYPGELHEPLTELGFPTGDAVIGKTQLAFDITDFMQLLVLFPGQHQFKLTITDSNGNVVSKTLTFLAQ